VITPQHHYQVQKVIKAFGLLHLEERPDPHSSQLKALKYRLAPIFVRNEIEQEKFYDLFEQYIEEIKKAELKKSVPSTQPSIDTSSNKTIYWLLLALIGLLGIAVLFQICAKPIAKPSTKLQCDFQILNPNQEVAIGDTLKTNNLSDTSRNIHYTWEIFDETAKEPHHQSKEHHLEHHFHTLEKGKHKKEVCLIAHDTLGPYPQQDTLVKKFTIVCQKKPIALTIQTDLVENFAKVDTEIAFSLAPKAEKNIRYEWTFEKEAAEKEAVIKVGSNPTYRYPKKGVYEIILRASKDTIGHCETIIKKSISVGSEQAPLEYMDPKADRITPRIQFRNWLWIPLVLLPLLSWFYCYWREQKAKLEQEKALQEARLAAEQKAQEQLKEDFAAPDKAPYYIPYQNNDGLIRMARETYRMADILRTRQEGLRQELDIPKSIQHTIEQGGFPSVATRYSTMPSEYLFLLDELESNSHQKRLFQFLTQFLRDKDIHLEAYWYRGTMHHFWNKQSPKGLGLETLRRLYPKHKLVVMGKGHELLHPYGGTNLIRPEFAHLLQEWTHRVLLTPQPVVSWTYREEALSKLLLPFPADMKGFRSALPYLDMDQEEIGEQAIDFDQRQSELRTKHFQPDVNYKKWRKLKDYEAYLAKHSHLKKWLYALAVHPHPTWEISVAIGRALESPAQPLVTYDNLLILSHIPWLQGKDLSPRLRKAFLVALQQLDPNAETKARQAVQAALQADKVKAAIKDSHANFEWQKEQVFQEFALHPNNAENNRKLQFLLDKLNRRQRMALEQSLERNFQAGLLQAQAKDLPDLEKHIATTLAGKTGATAIPTPNVPFKWWFYAAVGMSLFAILSAWILFSFNKTDRLYELVKGKAPVAIKCEDRSPLNSLQSLFFMELCPMTSAAVQWNNHAVTNIWHKENFTFNTITANTYRRMGDARDTFQLAIEKAGIKDYPLARQNLDKLYYNRGTAYYEAYFKGEQRDANLLDTAYLQYKKVEPTDSILLETWHALGLVHHYQKEDSLARNYLGNILRQDSSWFDSLSLTSFPHLASLLTASTNKPIIPFTDEFLESIKASNKEGLCRKIAAVNYNLSLRRTRLSQAELNLLNRTDINNRLARIPLGAEVTLLDSVDNFYAVSYKGLVGWIVNKYRQRTTLVPCTIQPPKIAKPQVIEEKIPPTIEPPKPSESNFFIDPRDQQSYRTFIISEQTWMAQNLNYTSQDSWCYLELAALCEKAGRLYTWEAAQNVCPQGWHLPTDEEWTSLLDNFGGEGSVAYQELIAKGDARFAVLLGGVRSSNGEFDDLEQDGFYWSATELDADIAWDYNFYSVDGKVYRNSLNKSWGVSVRCLKD